MSQKHLPVLIRVNYMVEVPGFVKPFTCADLRFDQENKQLLIKTPEGIVTFGMNDDSGLQVRVLDLDVPAIIRAQQKDEGWETMPVNRLVTLLHHADLLTD